MLIQDAVYLCAKFHRNLLSDSAVIEQQTTKIELCTFL